MGAYYNYDASGERNFKLTGDIIELTQNGVPYNYAFLESPTLYASGLITLNERGYTKHYFEESTRVCSSIGGGFMNSGYEVLSAIPPIGGDSYRLLLDNAEQGIEKVFSECIKTPINTYYSQDKITNLVKDHEINSNDAEQPFYYTSDHLGSSSYITDESGAVTQTLAYLPYGEDWVDL
ncbi:MAG: hypothetical protein WCR29_07655, partial [Bacteroidales bacterium]